MHRPGSFTLVPALVTFFAVAAFVLVLNFAILPPEKSSNTNTTNRNTNLTVCTDDAKICPDGSAVGRTGPNCEFTLCPGESEVSSFEECEAAGYPVMESYPRQCSANRQTFTEVIANGNSNSTNGNTNAATDPTTGWKTYENQQRGYSIRYPSDWTMSESNNRFSFSGTSATGHPFSTPAVTVYQKDTLYAQDTCLIKQETVVVNGVDRIQQTEGCSYAGSEIATFFKVTNGYLVVSWTEDVPDQYPTYNLILSSFTITN